MPLARDVVRVLRLVRKRSVGEWVFGRPDPFVRKGFLRALEAAGIERETNEGKVDFHALRTTFSSHLAPVCSYPALKALMGHSFLPGDVTLRYQRLGMDEMRAALDGMGNPLRRCRGKDGSFGSCSRQIE